MSISIEFTNTKRGENPRTPSTTVYIDYDGTIIGDSRWPKDGMSITIRGGDNTSVGTVSPVIPHPFYMTNAQLLSLRSILLRVNSLSNDVIFTSSNGGLKELATGIFRTYAG